MKSIFSIVMVMFVMNIGTAQLQEVKEIAGAEISFVTTQGTQSWAVGEARFSISKVGEGYCMNLWISSNDKRTTPQIDKEMDDSYGPNIECSVWLKELPTNLEGFEFKVPNYSDDNEDDYGYDYYASNNMYFYEHHTMENIIVKVEKKNSDNTYELSWKSESENVFDWELPKMKVVAKVQLPLMDTLKGYWLE